VCHKWLLVPPILPTDRHYAQYKLIVLYCLVTGWYGSYHRVRLWPLVTERWTICPVSILWFVYIVMWWMVTGRHGHTRQRNRLAVSWEQSTKTGLCYSRFSWRHRRRVVRQTFLMLCLHCTMSVPASTVLYHTYSTAACVVFHSNHLIVYTMKLLSVRIWWKHFHRLTFLGFYATGAAVDSLSCVVSSFLPVKTLL